MESRCGILCSKCDWQKTEKCKGCSKCARNCPVGAISGKIKEPFTIDNSVCIKCGACESNCAFGAIHIES